MSDVSVGFIALPTSTVVIVTKDRWEDLSRAIESALNQSASPEIVVLDDGSTDATPHQLPKQFPTVKYLRNETSRGCVVRRNEAASIASGEIVFSIDDDAEFSTPFVVEQTLKDFEAADVAAVAIPYIEPNKEDRPLQVAPDRENIWITDVFRGTAYAVRKQNFLRLGGFRADLVHQGEERDFCQRLLEIGEFVRLGRSDVIIHHESPKRDLRKMHFYGRRNDLLFAAQNAPRLYLSVHLIGTTLNGLRAAIGERQGSSMIHGLLIGWRDAMLALNGRKPVSSAAYLSFRELRKRGPFRLCQMKSPKG